MIQCNAWLNHFQQFSCASAENGNVEVNQVSAARISDITIEKHTFGAQDVIVQLSPPPS